MKIRKYRLVESGVETLAVLENERWIRIDRYAEETYNEDLKICSGELISFLQYYEEHKERLIQNLHNASVSSEVTSDMEEVIPFQPLLYRDFLLSDTHMINAGRGLVKMTMRNLYPIVKGYELIFRRPFPKLKPSKAFYQHPLYYKGNHLSFLGDKEELAFPEYTTLKDYELEVGMIITKEIYDATEQEGVDAIGAFCILNDFSARNVQYEEMNSTGPCKSKDFASSISNTVVTADEVLPYLYKLKTTVIINGKVVATGSTECFQYSFGAAVAYASKGENVYPGEFIGSGTVVNCCGLENGHFLEKGDTIRLEIERLGSLTNKIL